MSTKKEGLYVLGHPKHACHEFRAMRVGGEGQLVYNGQGQIGPCTIYTMMYTVYSVFFFFGVKSCADSICLMAFVL